MLTISNEACFCLFTCLVNSVQNSNQASLCFFFRESALRPTTLTPQVLCCVLPCDEDGHYRHGSLRSNYALFHPNVHPPLCPRCSIADLGELTSASPLPIREGCVQSLFKNWIGGVALGGCEGGIDETPWGESWHSKAAAKPWTQLSATLRQNIFQSSECCCQRSRNMHFAATVPLLSRLLHPRAVMGHNPL